MGGEGLIKKMLITRGDSTSLLRLFFWFFSFLSGKRDVGKPKKGDKCNLLIIKEPSLKKNSCIFFTKSATSCSSHSFRFGSLFLIFDGGGDMRKNGWYKGKKMMPLS